VGIDVIGDYSDRDQRDLPHRIKSLKRFDGTNIAVVKYGAMTRNTRMSLLASAEQLFAFGEKRSWHDARRYHKTGTDFARTARLCSVRARHADHAAAV